MRARELADRHVADAVLSALVGEMGLREERPSFVHCDGVPTARLTTDRQEDQGVRSDGGIRG